MGELPHERAGERLRVFLGDLCAGEQRRVYTRVLTPPDVLGTSVVLHGELGYADLAGRTATISAELAFSYARDAEVLHAPIFQELLTRASTVEVATAANQALRLERAGRRQEAQTLMQHTLAAAAPHMPAVAAADYAALAARMQHGLHEDERKQEHFKSYQMRNSRK